MEMKSVKIPMNATRVVRIAKISKKIKGDTIAFLLERGLNNLDYYPKV